MKKLIVKGVLSGFIISMVISCNEKKEEAAAAVVDKEQIKKDIQAREDEYAALYNSGELKNIGYYADDATTYYENRAPLVGKEPILAFLKSDLASNTDKISFKTNEIFASGNGDHVLEIGYYKVVDSANNPINTGNYMSLFEKRNGKYVCLRDMSTTDMPVK
jgi:ketosteroid isomerase-like protein